MVHSNLLRESSMMLAEILQPGFHTAWIKDSHPNLTGNDYYRKSAQTLFESDQYTADTVKTASDGSLIAVNFKNHLDENAVTEEYPSAWLHMHLHPMLEAPSTRRPSQGSMVLGCLVLDHCWTTCTKTGSPGIPVS